MKPHNIVEIIPTLLTTTAWTYKTDACLPGVLCTNYKTGLLTLSVFFSPFAHRRLGHLPTAFTGSMSQSQRHHPDFSSTLSRCFSYRVLCGYAPAWGRRANSRPCDCTQESEDCVTACGERPQEWTEEGGREEEEATAAARADAAWVSQQLRETVHVFVPEAEPRADCRRSESSRCGDADLASCVHR